MTMENGKRKDKDKDVKLGNRALLDVDERIVMALAERDEATRKVSLLIYWQDRLARINTDIDMLITIQQRLTGKVPEPATQAPAPFASAAIPYSHSAVIPPNISSVPRQANPQPSGANVAADVEGEGGFGL